MKANAQDYDVIRRQVVTEKSSNLAVNNSVLFVVDRRATKPRIKMAVERIFNVKVKRVTTLIRKGKMRRFRNRMGRTATEKRAVVTLADGNSIDLSSNVGG